QQLEARRRRRQRAIAESVSSRLEQVADKRRRIVGRSVDGFEHLAETDRIPDLKRTDLPSESPPHRPVHIVNRMGEVGGDARGVEQQWAERRPQKRADAVAAEKQGLRSLGDVLDRACRVERGEARRLTGAVRQAGGIERENLGAARTLLSLVEPLAALLA